MDKIDEILSRFPTEAREIYNKSQLFHNAVHAIAAGADPYTLLYDTIKACDMISQEFTGYVTTDKRPPQYILTTQERIDEIKKTGKL
jgi:hypothetical protein